MPRNNKFPLMGSRPKYDAQGHGPIFGAFRGGMPQKYPDMGPDTVDGKLRPHEYVLRPEAVQALGGPSEVDKLNAMGGPNRPQDFAQEVPPIMEVPAPIMEITQQDRHGNKTTVKYDTKVSGAQSTHQMLNGMGLSDSVMQNELWNTMTDWMQPSVPTSTPPPQYKWFGGAVDAITNWFDDEEDKVDPQFIANAAVADIKPMSDASILAGSSDALAGQLESVAKVPAMQPEVSKAPTSNIYDQIAGHEGFRDKAYQDSAGVWTIGYGRTTNPDGSPIQPGQTTTQDQENVFFKTRVDQDKQHVMSFAKQHGYNWTPNQIDALTSFTYNLGPGGLNQLTAGGTRSNEEILAKLPEYNKAGGQFIQGLQNRRNVEAQQFGSTSTPNLVALAGPENVLAEQAREGSLDYLGVPPQEEEGKSWFTELREAYFGNEEGTRGYDADVETQNWLRETQGEDHNANLDTFIQGGARGLDWLTQAPSNLIEIPGKIVDRLSGNEVDWWETDDYFNSESLQAKVMQDYEEDVIAALQNPEWTEEEAIQRINDLHLKAGVAGGVLLDPLNLFGIGLAKIPAGTLKAAAKTGQGIKGLKNAAVNAVRRNNTKVAGRPDVPPGAIPAVNVAEDLTVPVTATTRIDDVPPIAAVAGDVPPVVNVAGDVPPVTAVTSQLEVPPVVGAVARIDDVPPIVGVTDEVPPITVRDIPPVGTSKLADDIPVVTTKPVRDIEPPVGAGVTANVAEDLVTTGRAGEAAKVAGKPETPIGILPAARVPSAVKGVGVNVGPEIDEIRKHTASQVIEKNNETGSTVSSDDTTPNATVTTPTGETVDVNENDAKNNTSTGEQNAILGIVGDVFREMFGIDDRQDLARAFTKALVMYAGGRLTGMSGNQALALAAKSALAEGEAQQKRAEWAISDKAKLYNKANRDKFVRTGNYEDLGLKGTAPITRGKNTGRKIYYPGFDYPIEVFQDASTKSGEYVDMNGITIPLSDLTGYSEWRKDFSTESQQKYYTDQVDAQIKAQGLQEGHGLVGINVGAESEAAIRDYIKVHGGTPSQYRSQVNQAITQYVKDAKRLGGSPGSIGAYIRAKMVPVSIGSNAYASRFQNVNPEAVLSISSAIDDSVHIALAEDNTLNAEEETIEAYANLLASADWIKNNRSAVWKRFSKDASKSEDPTNTFTLIAIEAMTPGSEIFNLIQENSEVIDENTDELVKKWR